MLQRLILSLTLLVVVLMLGVSCSHAPTVSEANRLLEGRWELALGHDCRDYGIRSDNLILHSDGRLEQHFVSAYDQRYDSTSERWSYLPDDAVNFDTRRDFFAKQPANGVVGTSIHET